MAGIQADLDMRKERLLGPGQGKAGPVSKPPPAQRQEPLPEEGRYFGAGLHQAVGLGFQVQVDEPTGPFPDFQEPVGQDRQVPGDAAQALFIRRGQPGFVGERRGGDTPFQAGRQELLQDLDEPERIIQPRRLPPIRGKDLVLHPGAVKGAVGEAVQGENIEVVGRQKVLEGREAVTGEQLLAFGGGETQAQPEGSVGGEAGFQPGHAGLKLRPDLLPAMAGMDLAAIGQVGQFRGGELHDRILA